MSDKDGGDAFPGGGYIGHGMSLRDYFAAHALYIFSDPTARKSLIEHASRQGSDGLESFAHAVYELADAMIAERSK